MSNPEAAFMIELRPATEQDIREFTEWHYEPPYSVYDIDMTPDEAVGYFLESDIYCHTLLDGNAMVGYCTFGHDAQVPGGNYDADGIDIGLGVKPERTGAGEGSRYVAAVVAFALGTFDPPQLRVTIAAGNIRALRVWSGVGFSEVSRFAPTRDVMESGEFAILALTPTDHSQHPCAPFEAIVSPDMRGDEQATSGLLDGRDPLCCSRPTTATGVSNA
jgi:RimJ/RimL family protein N-acetyltransferase